MSNPDRFERFLGAALLAGGALVFALCGLCTLSLAGPAVLGAIQNGWQRSNLAGGLMLYGIVGGVPTIGGFLVMRLGWRMFRGPKKAVDD